MLKKLIVKLLINKIQENQKTKGQRNRERLRKKIYKKRMLKMFGKTRYYLAWWFGSWILFTFNQKWYEMSNKEVYQKFYTDEDIANKYAERLKEKYIQVQITKVYDKKKKLSGYILNGKGKKVAESTQQPLNVVSFQKYRLAKAK